MNEGISRRDIFLGLGAAAAAMSFGASALSAEPAATEPTNSSWPTFPHLDPKLVAEVVGKSHSDEKRVRELVDAHPTLVNAAWDWGFGDWESALGAAAHTGRRSIAELLIERGARIDIFAAAMLGYTDVVKAFVSARPGVQRLLGPHGIPLLAHARAGGDEAKDTFEYLKSLGDAGNGPDVKPIEDAEKRNYIGTYTYGLGEKERLDIRLDDRGNLIFQAAGGSRMRIHSLGNNQFFPSGVPSTKLVFDLVRSPAVLTISATSLTLLATRTVGP
jgi:hypothetical protein